MTDTNLYRFTPRRCSVFESDNDQMKSTANPRIYPSRFIPPGRDESHPNVSGSGFIASGTQLQSQRNRCEVRVARVMERFGRLKMESNEREMLIKSQVIFPDVINRQFNSLSRVIQELAKEALSARVEFFMCGDIANYKTIINQIRWNAMKGIDPQNDLALQPVT